MDSDDEYVDEGFLDDLNHQSSQPSTQGSNPSSSGSAQGNVGANFGSARGRGGLFGGFPGGGWASGGGGFSGHAFARPPARAFSKNYRAYSTAILEVKQGRGDRMGGRSNVMHGGKIIMPQDALLDITDMEMESPYMFEVKNTGAGKQHLITHCGVLEFIADPGTVHLPQWMMTQLQLNEGDPIKLTGARLPKGKFAKVQAQSPLFLELSDHKAVLESALRNFSCLTKGDIIEIYHNMMTFELLIMELKPDDAPAVSIFETDLEIDFATPKGYVEPAPTPAAPIPTMASRLQINASGTQKVDARGSGSGASTPSLGGEAWEAFRGGGRTMGGKLVKGKGVARKKIEAVEEGSRIWRTDQAKIVTADTQLGDRHVPAALDLPYGTLFFGFNVATYAESEAKKGKEADQNLRPFGNVTGAGTTLSGRSRPSASAADAESTSASTGGTSTTTPSVPAGSSTTSSTNQSTHGVAFSGQGHSLSGGNIAKPPDPHPKGSMQDPIELD